MDFFTLRYSVPALKRKCLHFDEIFIIGCTESCQNDNFQCSQWWKFRQNDDIFVSVRTEVFRGSKYFVTWPWHRDGLLTVDTSNIFVSHTWLVHTYTEHNAFITIVVNIIISVNKVLAYDDLPESVESYWKTLTHSCDGMITISMSLRPAIFNERFWILRWIPLEL